MLGAFICLPRAAHAQFGLITLPINDPAYVQLEGLERAGCAAARVSVDRPYQVRLIRAALVVASREAGCAGPVLDALVQRFAIHPGDTGMGLRAGGEVSLQATGYHNGVFEPLWDNVRPASQGDAPAVATLRGRVTWGDGDVGAVVLDGYGTTSYANNPTVSNARIFRHTSGVVDFTEAYGAVRAGVFTFSLGRAPEAWLGEGPNSLVLNANGPAYNRVAVDFHTAHFEGRIIYGTLDDVAMDSAHDGWQSAFGTQVFYRYITGHSITWRPSTAIELTGGETALLSRGTPTIDLLTINPFIPYQITQKDTGRSAEHLVDNLTAFFGIRTRIDRVTAAAELLIDDIQIDATAQGKTPDQLGYVLTLSSPLPIRVPATVQLQYQRVDSYTYLRAYYTSVYQQYNVPLGSELGPDADIATLSGEVFPTGWIRVAADIGYWRRGLQRIYERPAQEATGHAGAPFPTNLPGQPVQLSGLADASVQFLTPMFPITAQVTAARITNANNQPVGAATYVQAQLYASYALHYP